MALATDRNGNILLDFIRGDSPTLPKAEVSKGRVIKFAVIAARYEGQYLIVYEIQREQWELPGGRVEPDETLHECALREFQEETGQTASKDSMLYCGLLKVQFKNTGHIEYGAMYRVELATLHPFTPNDEISAIKLWDLTSALDTYMNACDIALVKLAYNLPD